MNQEISKPEILAPAGSMEALRAAVYAGADAVYLGGSQFSARAYADNFGEPDLISAIEYCHIYGVKVYLTVNTLFRNEEMEMLYGYLCPLYEAGLDAVIVQDLGVLYFIHQCFPDLPIHASTQMTITTESAFTVLENYGVTRIIPARELSMEEIAALKQAGRPEVEVFVQGALCYCYSGTCLMSSMLGGRSGNRGRCAQPCRLPYSVSDRERQYYLSPKDLCGLEAVGDLVAAGVDSFKIEGRMKRPEYVAACVDAYRAVVDAFFSGQDRKPLIAFHRQRMAEVFNRGGFTEGYYHQHNGRDMMSMKNPANAGVQIGKVLETSKNQIGISLSKAVCKGDILKLQNGKNEKTLTCNTDRKPGQNMILNIPKNSDIKSGQSVYRMYHAPLMTDLSDYAKREHIIEVKGKASFLIGQAARFTIEAAIGKTEIRVTVFGDMVEPARGMPLTREAVIQKLGQTGNTRYHFFMLDAEVEQGAFYNIKPLKDLRRRAFLMLEEQLVAKGRRKKQEDGLCSVRPETGARTGERGKDAVAVSSKEQYDLVSRSGLFEEIYLDLQYFTLQDITWILGRGSGKEHYVMLPPVLRTAEWEEIRTLFGQMDRLGVCGFVVRNIDEIAYLHSVGYQGKIITDFGLYAMNDYAVHVIRSLFPRAVITLPVELNHRQLGKLIGRTENVQLVGYGYQQLMVSAQCLQQNRQGCSHNNGWFTMYDRYHKPFFVKCVCKYCYNLIYNGIPTVLYDVVDKEQFRHCSIRLHFTKENTEEMRKVISAFERGTAPDMELTRGHLNRGVE